MGHDCTETNKDKLTKVLLGYEKQHENALDQMETAHTRLQGATEGVLKRRFIWDITNHHDRIIQLRGKILWAERMLNAVTTKLEVQKQEKEDAEKEAAVMKECCMSGNLTHSPFKQLQAS
jgi:hypothetical protein